MAHRQDRHESVVTGCLVPVLLACLFGGLLLYGASHLLGLFD